MEQRLIRIDDLVREGGADRAVRRAASRGEVVRLAGGRYLEADAWKALARDEKYLMQVRSVAEAARSLPVLSHWSAAVVWGYPVIGPWPSKVHTIVGSRSGQRSSARVERHPIDIRDDEITMVDGLLVTTPLRTLCDLARIAPFEAAVASLDRGLCVRADPEEDPLRVNGEELHDSLARLDGRPGVRTARAALAFADGRADFPGESLSRVQMARLRFPRPELQVEIVDLDGRLWHTDFGWERFGLLGEFDGAGKYLRQEYLHGKDTAQAVLDEKAREDAIRLASGRSMVRWPWAVARDLRRLERHLSSAGLRPESHRRLPAGIAER